VNHGVAPGAPAASRAAGPHLEVLQRLLAGLADVLGAVAGVPELGADEEVLAAHLALGKDLLERLADLGLVLVGHGAVDVAVASGDGGLDRGLDFAGLALPRAEADRGHRDRAACVARPAPQVAWCGRRERTSGDEGERVGRRHYRPCPA